MNNTNKTVVTIVAVVVAVLIFFGGYNYGESKSGGTMAAANGGFSGATTQGTGTRSGGRGGFGGGAGGYAGRGNASSTMGTILSKDADSITVQLEAGGSKIVFVSSSTPVLITSPGTLSNLQVGQTISVQGTTNSDGSESASSVMVRPAGMTGTRTASSSLSRNTQTQPAQ